MTKQDLNKLINASVQYNAYTGTWSIDIDRIYKQYSDDLNAFVKKFVDFQPIIEHYEQMVEQEKKEQARDIFEKLLNAEIQQGHIYISKNFIDLAKEYGVEL